MKHRIFRSIVIGGLLAFVVIAFSPRLVFAIDSVGKEKLSAYQPQVQSPMLEIGVLEGVDKNTAFLVEGLDYGDVVVMAIVNDTIVGNAAWNTLTLDSVYWQSKDYDSLACGIDLDSGYVLFYYYNLTD